MERLKNFVRNHKVTVMIIPNSQKGIKQKNANVVYMFLFLLLLIILNLAFMANTFMIRKNNVALKDKTKNLEAQIIMKDDTITNMELDSQNKLDEIENLTATIEESNQYLEDKLKEMSEVQDYMNNILGMFNSNTAANVDIPVSRSFVRENPEGDAQIAFASTNDGKLEALKSQTELDEISGILESEALDYSKLATQVERQLEYLDCRPDTWPTHGVLTSGFGYRIDPVYGTSSYHRGQDIANSVGTHIYAAGSGYVSFAGYGGEYGNVVIINHGYGYQSIYAHNSKLLVNVNDRVEKGDLIAQMGNSGKSTGSHLHFEVRFNGSAINPLSILKY